MNRKWVFSIHRTTKEVVDKLDELGPFESDSAKITYYPETKLWFVFYYIKYGTTKSK